jgi:DNA-directed RNA polymerase specialized sigma24 family protein
MRLSLREELIDRYHLPDSDAVLVGRAELLAPSDRELLKAVLVHGQRPSAVAALLRQPANRLRQRLYRLCRRLTSSEFLSAARALSYLDKADAEWARLYFCERRSQRELAEQFQIAPHHVRRRVEDIASKVAAIRHMFERTRQSSIK